MNRLKIYTFSLLTILLLSACADSHNSNYKELSWEDLEPDQESSVDVSLSSLEVIDNRYTDDFEFDGDLPGLYSGPPRQSLSVGVVSELDGTSIRVPGFVVPVEFDGENLVTEFFLVPYFGACFHKPPPPPNQTIYVVSATPVEYQSIYDPVWITGVVSTTQTGNEIATAAYTMDLHRLVPYED